MTTSKLGLTAARGTLLSIALRLASFILSQATVRFVSAAALGKASVPLELLLGTRGNWKDQVVLVPVVGLASLIDADQQSVTSLVIIASPEITELLST